MKKKLLFSLLALTLTSPILASCGEDTSSLTTTPDSNNSSQGEKPNPNPDPEPEPDKRVTLKFIYEEKFVELKAENNQNIFDFVKNNRDKFVGGNELFALAIETEYISGKKVNYFLDSTATVQDYLNIVKQITFTDNDLYLRIQFAKDLEQYKIVAPQYLDMLLNTRYGMYLDSMNLDEILSKVDFNKCNSADEIHNLINDSLNQIEKLFDINEIKDTLITSGLQNFKDMYLTEQSTFFQQYDFLLNGNFSYQAFINLFTEKTSKLLFTDELDKFYYDFLSNYDASILLSLDFGEIVTQLFLKELFSQVYFSKEKLLEINKNLDVNFFKFEYSSLYFDDEISNNNIKESDFNRIISYFKDFKLSESALIDMTLINMKVTKLCGIYNNRNRITDVEERYNKLELYEDANFNKLKEEFDIKEKQIVEINDFIAYMFNCGPAVFEPSYFIDDVIYITEDFIDFHDFLVIDADIKKAYLDNNVTLNSLMDKYYEDYGKFFLEKEEIRDFFDNIISKSQNENVRKLIIFKQIENYNFRITSTVNIYFSNLNNFSQFKNLVDSNKLFGLFELELSDLSYNEIIIYREKFKYLDRLLDFIDMNYRSDRLEVVEKIDIMKYYNEFDEVIYVDNIDESISYIDKVYYRSVEEIEKLASSI